jgi:hypothetical protein
MSVMSMKNFADLARFAARPFPVGYPVEDHVPLYAPDDKLPEALAFFVDQAEHSLSLMMSGFDDMLLATAILRKLQDPHVFVQLCLDSPLAAGTHKAALLTAMAFPTNTVAFGLSDAPALRLGVMDGLDCFTGFGSGEGFRDSALTFSRHPLVAFQSRHKIDLIHASMLTQMTAERV